MILRRKKYYIPIVVDLTTFCKTDPIFPHSLKKLTSRWPNPNLKISVCHKPKPQG